MSGDSSHHPVAKKIEEESSLIVPDKNSAVLAGVGTASVMQDAQLDTSTDKDINEKQDVTKRDDPKDTSGDSINDKDSDYIEVNERNISNASNTLEKKNKLSDNVDSVFLKPPPAHKARTSTQTPEDESCGMKCLYYTLQCCDCVLM